jgi:hypothetical protein
MSGSSARAGISNAPRALVASRQLAEDERALLTGATRVAYRRETGAIELYLRSGIIVQIPRSLVLELASASEDALQDELTVAVGGDAISLRSLDVDISVSGLLRDLFGFNIQRKGGQARTKAKAAAARSNGAKGGRPRKA